MHVKLHPKRPFGVKNNLYNAYANYKKQIILGKPILEELTEDEQKALVAHELTHIQKYHYIKSTISPIVAIGLIFLIIIILLPKYYLCSIVFIVLSVISVIVYIKFRRFFEYEADAGAVNYVGKNHMFSYLNKQLKFRKKKDLDKIFHPSLENRIRRIERLSPKK